MSSGGEIWRTSRLEPKSLLIQDTSRQIKKHARRLLAPCWGQFLPRYWKSKKITVFHQICRSLFMRTFFGIDMHSTCLWCLRSKGHLKKQSSTKHIHSRLDLTGLSTRLVQLGSCGGALNWVFWRNLNVFRWVCMMACVHQVLLIPHQWSASLLKSKIWQLFKFCYPFLTA